MNPFEQLHIDDATAPPSNPDPRFATRLRAQLEAALTPVIQLPEREDRTPMTDTISTTTMPPRPPRRLLVPYIAVHDASAALQWYADALDGDETVRYVGDDGRIGHAEMTIHGARIMLSDAYPEIGVVAANSYEGSSCALHLEVADIDAVHSAAVAAGATSLRDPEDQPHGSRMSTVLDPFGHRWMFSQTISTPTAAEIDASMSGFTVVESTPGTLRGRHSPGRPGQGARSSWGTTRSTPPTSARRPPSTRRCSVGPSIPTRGTSATATCRSASRRSTATASDSGCR